jgi:NADPH-dependent curcumin reductase CurA
VSARLNRRLVLAERPVGVPQPRHFRRDDIDCPAISAGQFLVRNLLLSIDPAQRGWVNADSNYSTPVPIGAVMRSLALGVVDESQHPSFARGDHLYGWFGWQDFCLATDKEVLRRVDPAQAPLPAAAGVLGIAGLAGYLALTDIGCPRAGETVLVSTAAGAVGSVVGQVAKRLGCEAIGLVGSDEKIVLCKRRLGYRDAMNYKQGFTVDALRARCPKGIDVFFDNTSGMIADTVWPLLNTRARIIQCGTAAEPIWSPVPVGPRRDREILTKRLRHEGFIIFDHVEKFPAAAETLAGWIREGALHHEEDISDGLDAAPAALLDLYRGANHGKKLVRV